MHVAQIFETMFSGMSEDEKNTEMGIMEINARFWFACFEESFNQEECIGLPLIFLILNIYKATPDSEEEYNQIQSWTDLINYCQEHSPVDGDIQSEIFKIMEGIENETLPLMLPDSYEPSTEDKDEATRLNGILCTAGTNPITILMFCRKNDIRLDLDVLLLICKNYLWLFTITSDEASEIFSTPLVTLDKVIFTTFGIRDFKDSRLNSIAIEDNKVLKDFYNNLLDMETLGKFKTYPSQKSPPIAKIQNCMTEKTAHILEILNECPFEDTPFYSKQVEPKEFLEFLTQHYPEYWLSSALDKPSSCEANRKKSDTQTIELDVLLKAQEKFWGSYNENSTHLKPKKGIISDWIKDEGKKRGINISNSLSNAMDTIIRPESCRIGGNQKFYKD